MTSRAHKLVIAAAQGSQGVLPRDEILRQGMSPSALQRRIAAGEWAVLFPGVVTVTRGDSVWHQRVAGARLWAGPTAAVSHRTAAALWRMDGFPRDIVEISTVRRKDPNGLDIVLHTTSSFEKADLATVDQISVTSPTRTLIDLGAVTTADLVELALDDALRRGLTSIARLRWFVDRHSGRGRRGIATLKSLLHEKARQGSVSESGFETRLFQRLRSAGLPSPVPQYEVRDEGRLVARVDFAYPDVRLAIEAVSYKWHSGRRDWNRDQVRCNALAALGWRVVNVTWEEMRARHDEVVATIRRARGEQAFFSDTDPLSGGSSEKNES